jgi:mono/diheme cytochrome c family protein
MLKNLIYVALAASIAVGIAYANQSASTTVLKVNKTAATDGKQMYSSYCAPCHGVNGRGDGPVASALKQKPVDLTVLSRNNGGNYPAVHVNAVLQFGTENPAHGTAQMPVWGPVLGRMDSDSTQHDTRALRISNLSNYIKTLQVQ